MADEVGSARHGLADMVLLDGHGIASRTWCGFAVLGTARCCKAD